MFEPCPKSRRSVDAEASLFSIGWLGDRTFGGRKRPSDYKALNDGTEPILTYAARRTDDRKVLIPAL